MTPRERVLAAIAHRIPDRVPFNLRPGAEIMERFRQEFGDADFAEHFRHDVRYVAFGLPERPPQVPVQEWTPLPSPAARAAAEAEVHRWQAQGIAVCGSYMCGVFEQMKAWHGDVDTMTMPFEDPAGLARELQKITEWKSAAYGAYARAGVDIVWMGDDLGTQRSLIMSPDQYRQWYRPCHKAIVDTIRAIRPDVRIAFHCCGFVTPLIPDLIDAGIDILEAVQAEAMDIAALKREFGRDISFWGGVGAQSVLARTSPAEVVEGVRRTLAIMAPGGGYIAAPCHTLTAEVPWESVLAFHEAVAKFGAYGNY